MKTHIEQHEDSENNDSWVNLKGGGKLASESGNGEQMCGMVPGLGSVSGLPSKEGFMSLLSRSVSDDGDLSRVCSGVF